MYSIRSIGRSITGQINCLFINKEPWQIVAWTSSSILATLWLYEFINQDEGVIPRIKKILFRMVRKVPSVRKTIDKKLKEIDEDFRKNINNLVKDCEYYTELPLIGYDEDKILSIVDHSLSLSNYKWDEGKVSGAVYSYDSKVRNLVAAVYNRASYTNPLHSDLFPGICKMEAEVVRMTSNLFHGSSTTCGTMTTGGTESLVLACKAYRDFGRESKGITKPNIVIPKTAHAGFDKGAQYMGLYIKYVKIDPQTTQVDIKRMEKAINKNTVLLVGSAPNFPYGTMDDIEEIAKLGQKYNIPVHVDACLGGFVIVFMKRAGYPLRAFDFTVKGVTSISADPHKYGFAPKGCSVILYSDRKYLSHQFTVTTDWPGGVYGSPTINGSRAGGIIAACWATMMNYGLDGYTETTKAIIDTAKYIEIGLRQINGIFIFGTPATSVIAIGSKDFDVFRLSDALHKLGWNLNTLQFPSGIHICVTLLHTKPGVADMFLKDVRESTKALMENPTGAVEGKMAIYGVAQTLPDRTLVSDFTKLYLHSTYYTPCEDDQV